MTRNAVLQFISATALAGIGFFLVNPLHVWMPSMAHELMLAASAVAFGIVAVFVLAEGKGDERENAHRSFAGRAAFFAGGVVLLVGIITEGLQGTPDPWLVGALVAMVVGKVGAHIHASRYC
ncbi:hypothetical protein HY418_01390 [Candidatus Kaiserbacteria bacterium]|nr:hypothetical protein [Candidatus Kaiserbacteria bacterium]